ncbi:MAG: hypothetical protein ACOYK9_05300 [Chlamydiia bacterium]
MAAIGTDIHLRDGSKLPTLSSPLPSSSSKVKGFVDGALNSAFFHEDVAVDFYKATQDLVFKIDQGSPNQDFLGERLEQPEKNIVSPTGALAAGLALNTSVSVLGLTSNSMNLHSAIQRQDTEGKKVFGVQVVRFMSKIGASISAIAAAILASQAATAVTQKLETAVGALGTIAMASMVVISSLRIHDMRRLSKTGYNEDKIRKQFIHFTVKDLKSCGASKNQLFSLNEFDWGSGKIPTGYDGEMIEKLLLNREGKLDRLSRALGGRDLAIKVANKQLVEKEELEKSAKVNKAWFVAILVGAIVSDILGILSLAFTFLKPAQEALSILMASFWTIIDGKFFIDDIRSQKQISTSVKVAYVVMIALSITAIVAGSLLTFGALPITIVAGIGVASAIASLAPYVIRCVERRKAIREQVYTQLEKQRDLSQSQALKFSVNNGEELLQFKEALRAQKRRRRARRRLKKS